MKIGTQQIQHIIYEQLTRARAEVPGGRGKFAKDTAKLIYDALESDMSKKDWDLFHGFPSELEPVVNQLRRGFGFEPMRDESAQEVYRWLAEQGEDKINKFIQWATAPERVQYITKYRKSPGLIKTEWRLAFMGTENKITRNDDGSLYV